MCGGGPAELALDNSALSNLLTRDFDAKRIAAVVRAANVRLVLTEFALGECLQGKPTAARNRYAGLWQLHELLHPVYFGVAVGLRTLLRSEQRGHSFGSTPMPTEPTYWQFLMHQAATEGASFEQRQPRLAQDAEGVMKKDLWRALDKGMAAEVAVAKKRAIRDDLPSLVDQLDATFAPGNWPVTTAVKLVHNEADRDRVAREVTASPWRSRAHAAMSALYWLNGIGAVMQGFHGGEHGPAVSSARGDWDDARIASNAAYCAFLLSDDEALRERMRVAAAAGLSFTLAGPATVLFPWLG